MPELPEVESARTVIGRGALHRVITGVDDTDSYVCRPHPPGEIRDALLRRTLTTAHRRGKSMWCDTSALAGHDGDCLTGRPGLDALRHERAWRTSPVGPGGEQLGKDAMTGREYCPGGRRLAPCWRCWPCWRAVPPRGFR